MAARTLINVPQKAKRGEVIQIKTLISHIMETGFRHDNVGLAIAIEIAEGNELRIFPHRQW